jgi:two-component sensor histidine kinase
LAIPLLESRLSESRLSESGQSGAIAGKSERVGAFVLAHDVTELRRRERALISKDATIREIHHRVKNNLQTVSALLRLQARRSEDPSASAALEEAVRRVTSIAWVHETLASNAAERVEFDSVVDRIIRSEIDLSLRDSDSPIGYQREGSFEELHAQIATPLAMVLTELIHNAIEHGLAESGSCLTVRSQRALDGRELLIDVIDDGVGISPEFSIEGSSNLGLEIVKTLTENELGGVISFSRNNPGTQVSIRIPLMGKNS